MVLFKFVLGFLTIFPAYTKIHVSYAEPIPTANPATNDMTKM